MTDEVPPEAGFELKLAKAMSHPLRQRLLMAYNQETTSPSELAVKLGEPLNEVAYHTRRLLDMDCVELVRTERGPGVKHFYRGVVRTELEDMNWSALPSALQRTLAAATLTQVVEEARAAAEAGALEAPDMHVSRLPLELDDKAWRELSALLIHVLDRAEELSRDSARRRQSGGALRSSILALFHFPRG